MALFISFCASGSIINLSLEPMFLLQLTFYFIPKQTIGFSSKPFAAAFFHNFIVLLGDQWIGFVCCYSIKNSIQGKQISIVLNNMIKLLDELISQFFCSHIKQCLQTNIIKVWHSMESLSKQWIECNQYLNDNQWQESRK